MQKRGLIRHGRFASARSRRVSADERTRSARTPSSHMRVRERECERGFVHAVLLNIFRPPSTRRLHMPDMRTKRVFAAQNYVQRQHRVIRHARRAKCATAQPKDAKQSGRAFAIVAEARFYF